MALVISSVAMSAIGMARSVAISMPCSVSTSISGARPTPFSSPGRPARYKCRGRAGQCRCLDECVHGLLRPPRHDTRLLQVSGQLRVVHVAGLQLEHACDNGETVLDPVPDLLEQHLMAASAAFRLRSCRSRSIAIPRTLATPCRNAGFGGKLICRTGCGLRAPQTACHRPAR